MPLPVKGYDITDYAVLGSYINDFSTGRRSWSDRPRTLQDLSNYTGAIRIKAGHENDLVVFHRMGYNPNAWNIYIPDGDLVAEAETRFGDPACNVANDYPLPDYYTSRPATCMDMFRCRVADYTTSQCE